MIIAGIGARATPSHLAAEMSFIGLWCRENGHWVRSGHAEGADWFFERGALENCIAYLPWAGFNDDPEKHGSMAASPAHRRVIKPNCHTLKITKQYHPAYDSLSYGVLCLMCRNVCQVLGENLDSPVNAVVCWTKDGKDSGGTGQAIRIAQDRGIPIINMFHPKYSDHIKVQDELQRINAAL